MKSKSELKEINIKNRVCHYFVDIINVAKINFSNILLDKKNYGLKLQQLQNHWVLGSIK